MAVLPQDVPVWNASEGTVTVFVPGSPTGSIKGKRSSFHGKINTKTKTVTIVMHGDSLSINQAQVVTPAGQCLGEGSGSPADD